LKLNGFSKILGLSLLLFFFTYLVGFLAGLILEKYYDFRGKEILFLGMSPKNTIGVTFAIGGWMYYWLLIFQKSKNRNNDKTINKTQE